MWYKEPIKKTKFEYMVQLVNKVKVLFEYMVKLVNKFKYNANLIGVSI